MWLRGLEDRWAERLLREPGTFPELELEREASWVRREVLRSDRADGYLRGRLWRTGRPGNGTRGLR